MIYFVKAEGTPYVKIGYAEDVFRRMSGMQTDCPHKIRLIRTVEGDYEQEKSFHHLFAAYHFRGEWFEITEDMIEDLDNFIDSYGHSDLWLKLEEHLKKLPDVNYKTFRKVLNDNFSRLQRKVIKDDEDRINDLLNKYRVNIGQE